MACDKGIGGVTGLAHVGVFVKDIEKSTEFYTNVLGFEVYFTKDIQKPNGIVKLVYIRCGSCAIELVQPIGYEGRPDGVVDHISVTVDDIDAAVKNLSAKGVKFDSPEPMMQPLFENGVRNIFFRGIDGERIELAQIL